ncbi:hypothetical protein [Paenibacillus macerans]|uniref:hypothetical protein n=1 Tax=Paenibacillus macerans TaxID=44252 RepID=UPI003D3156EE
MDWVNRVNQVIDYVENHLCGEIDEKEVSRIAACSFALFKGHSRRLPAFPYPSISAAES